VKWVTDVEAFERDVDEIWKEWEVANKDNTWKKWVSEDEERAWKELDVSDRRNVSPASGSVEVGSSAPRMSPVELPELLEDEDSSTEEGEISSDEGDEWWEEWEASLKALPTI
jgi:hypothetical protein